MKVLTYLQESDFWDDLNSMNIELVKETVNTILTAIESNSKKKKTKIFEVEISDEYILDFALEKSEYLSTLNNLLPTLIKHEEYELCSKVKEVLK